MYIRYCVSLKMNTDLILKKYLNIFGLSCLIYIYFLLFHLRWQDPNLNRRKIVTHIKMNGKIKCGNV